VVIGGLISSDVGTIKDKVHARRSPLLGRLFQSQSKDTHKKNLMIFVTATIVDPSAAACIQTRNCRLRKQPRRCSRRVLAR